VVQILKQLIPHHFWEVVILQLSASPSGVAGAIQFSDGSAFASDAANLFWDDTNNRLGIGTNAPTNLLHVSNACRLSNIYIGQAGNTAISNTGSDTTINLSNGVGIAGGSIITPTARLHIQGSGSTSATTSFLVQNSSGFNAIQVTDDLKVNINSLVFGGSNGYIGINNNPNIDSALRAVRTDGGTSPLYISSGEVGVGDATTYASAIFAIGSTTRGFLPPRMTTTQRDAITSPATGLKIYNTTLGTTDTYDGTTWQRFGQQTLIKGSGSTSATTSLLVQNSAGTNALQIRDDRVTNFEVPVSINGWNIISSDAKIGITPYSSGLGTLFNSTTPNGASYLPCTFWISNFFIEGSGGTQIGNSTGSINASAKLQVDSTTKGFLPPRMTNPQKNAIATPAAGLVVYDSTTNKLCCYDGSTWNDLF
jgi:hypothetical protein